MGRMRMRAARAVSKWKRRGWRRRVKETRQVEETFAARLLRMMSSKHVMERSPMTVGEWCEEELERMRGKCGPEERRGGGERRGTPDDGSSSNGIVHFQILLHCPVQ